MPDFFRDIKSSRQIQPNLFCWWNWDSEVRQWCATVNDSEGTQLCDAVYDADKYTAIIQSIRSLTNG